jgi:hypothetical protein
VRADANAGKRWYVHNQNQKDRTWLHSTVNWLVGWLVGVVVSPR